MNTIKPKGLEEFLKDDPSMRIKYTYQEYMDGKTNPGNTDHLLGDVYESYRIFLEKGNEKQS